MIDDGNSSDSSRDKLWCSLQALMEVFPKDVMVPKNAIQAEFMHYPRQQDTAIRVLIAMSNVGQ